MQMLFRGVVFVSLFFLFIPFARAETYFLKIEQAEIKGGDVFLQTCSPRTSPCTFMLPIALEDGGKKDIAVVMRVKESPNIYLQFYWDQALLGTNNFGEEYYTLLAGGSDEKLLSRIVTLYAPLSSAQKPAKGDPVLKHSEKVIASLQASAVITKEKE